MPAARPTLRSWLPAVGWAAVLFVLSTIPGPRFPKVSVPNADKFVHICLYAPLGAGILLALLRSSQRKLWTSVLWAIGLGTAYGVFDELHQLFTPFRSSDWHDVVADFIGSAIGASLLALRVRARAPGRAPAPPPSGTSKR